MTGPSATEAKAELRRLLETLERQRTSVMQRVCGPDVPEPWAVYPGESGVFDRASRSQFYYHRHEPSDHEAGHFHTVRLFRDRVAHLVGISMAPDGWPQALFTVNLWLVGDGEESVSNLKTYVRRFRLDERQAEADMSRAGSDASRPLMAAVICFVNLVFQAFLSDIEALQVEKARAIEQYRKSHGGSDPFDDRSVEVLSRIAIDVRA
ncbi:MAG: hypothetical protein HYU51_19140 [Candidatus Rokubacteria bacterium]|nr:hypothetical protein [Candidatus Rokubacteria bacterium]